MSREKDTDAKFRLKRIASLSLHKTFMRAAALTLVLQAVAPHASRAADTDALPVNAQFTMTAAVPGRGATELLGMQEIRSTDISAFSKWAELIDRFKAQLHEPAASSPQVIALWQEELGRLKGQSPYEQMQGVNDFLNQVRYVDDQQKYGLEGYWQATPVRFLSDGGDCKDYAIAKYVSLSALGFTTEQLRIAVVQDKIKNISHAILIVQLGGNSYVLDNQNKQITPAADVHRYKTIFSINRSSWWRPAF